ncbi:microtubule-associated protein RP/EB family member 1-like [Helianthus annuus]|uniref:microtubule-associated protein RP/EB family member 1-like n=1 Tax=Helianthus annuus TaxID=4232 RepID=UPI000B8FB508|nr:microtubule-associated protein RP/EB family member 1-like [Helianthus annuus]
MKEKSYADELKILESFKDTRNERFVKEEKKKKSRKATPKVQTEEGSSSQPKKKRQKRSVETMLVDESEEEAEAEDEAEAETEVYVERDARLSPNSAEFLKSLNAYNAEKEKAAGEEEGDDAEKSSSSSSDEEIDETERMRRIQAEVAKEKQLKRKRREEKDDDVYVPSPEHVIESHTPPSGGRKKVSARKSVVSPRAARKKLIARLPKRTLKTKSSQPPSPPPEPSPPKSPHKSPPKQPTPPPSPPPHLSPLHLSPLHQSPPHLSPPHQTPIQEQPVLTSQQIFQTPPLTQPPIQTTPGSSGYKTFPNIPEGITLEEIGDFNFASDVQVKSLEKKVEEVLVENKKLLDREKKLEKRVKSVEAENTSLLKKIEADQTEIDILKVKVAELEEEKARRDERNKYFELKNKELEAAKAMKEQEIYMMNKVLENMLGNHSDDDDDGQGGAGIKVTKASNEQNVDDYMHDDANEEHESAEGEGEHVDDQNVDKFEKLILRLEPEVEEREFRHTYTMADIKEMTRIVDPDFKFDFEEELNALDINQQPEYEYKYVDEADNYDRVEVEDCTDEESVNEDTSNFPTLVEFFSQENRDELRGKVAECLKDKNFDGTTKDPQREERKKWFCKDTERKFKRPLKFYKRDRDVSLGDIISWGFLPQVNAYAIRREYGV